MTKPNNRIGILNVFLICIITFPSCILNRHTKWENRFNYLPKEIKYDTLDDTFLFEGLMSYQVSGDAIVKSQSFIQFGDIGKKAYQNGIFIYGDFKWNIQKSGERDTNLHFDFSTVYKMMGQIQNDMNQEQEDSSNYYFNFNPFYGLYYAKFHLKIEVLYLGKVKQRIPMFFNNEAELNNYMKKHHNINYQICTIPTYLITKVFEWKRIR